jgi:uncharacterized protein (DUF1015 family)
MAGKKLIIADGHHRYETALAFRDERPELKDAQRVMMTFVNMDSPGLRILATHRLVDQADPDAFLARARAEFRVRAIDSVESLRKLWQEPHPDLIREGVAGPPGALHVLEANRARGELVVQFLHERILKDCLSIGQEEVRNEKRIRYVRGAEMAIQEIREGRANLGFLLEPTAVHDVARVAFSGGVMPQKSTDFYPKLLSGLTMYRLVE